MSIVSRWKWPLLLTHLALIITGMAALFSGPLGDNQLAAPAIMSLVIYGPLALFLPACWKADKRLLAWLSFLLMFYFCGYVLQATNPPPGMYWGITGAVLIAILFVLIVLAMRSPEAPHHD